MQGFSKISGSRFQETEITTGLKALGKELNVQIIDHAKSRQLYIKSNQQRNLTPTSLSRQFAAADYDSLQMLCSNRLPTHKISNLKMSNN